MLVTTRRLRVDLPKEKDYTHEGIKDRHGKPCGQTTWKVTPKVNCVKKTHADIGKFAKSDTGYTLLKAVVSGWDGVSYCEFEDTEKARKVLKTYGIPFAEKVRHYERPDTPTVSPLINQRAQS